MTPSLFSALWYRVAALRPRLTASVRVERQVSRGIAWYLLFVPDQGPPLRLNSAAYAFVGRLTGKRTVEEVWDILYELAPENAPTQDEIISILWRLHERRLLQPSATADLDSIFGEWETQNAKVQTRRWNPLALRVSLGNPSTLLDSLQPLARLFSWPVLAIWVLVVGYGALLAASNWHALVAYTVKWLATPYYALLALAVYPVIKGLHELGHGLALRRWRCDTREAGVTLLLLMPMPFVDASEAATLPRWPRVVVSAAGILVELFIAAVTLAIWLSVEPGLVRDIAFVSAFTAGVSSVLVNGNPLLRFDGYYVLIDALDLPNLASRSAAWWGALFRRYAMRVDPGDTPLPAPGERLWLIAYAPLSWTYRVALCIALTTWVGHISFLLGVAVGAAFAVMLLMPAVRALKNLLWGSALEPRQRTQAAAAIAGVVAVAAAVFAIVPVPFAAVSQGVVWLPEHARVRAETEGFVARIVAAHGTRIEKGDVVLVLQNPRVAAERAQLAARVAALEPEVFQAARTDPAKAAHAIEELEQARAELARSDERMTGLTVRAGATGTLVMPRQNDLVGSFARKGAMLGHVLTESPAVVRVAVAEAEAALINTRMMSADARLASEPRRALHAQVVMDAVGASAELPTAALSTRYGGDILTDPDDPKALKPLMPVVLVDARLPEKVQDRFGERAWVRFDFGAAPLAQQWLRRLRQTLLSQFNPGS